MTCVYKVWKNLLFVLLDLLLVKRVQGLQRKLEVSNERITSRLGKVFANYNAHKLHLFGVWRHGICRDDPSALTELVSTEMMLV